MSAWEFPSSVHQFALSAGLHRYQYRQGFRCRSGEPPGQCRSPGRGTRTSDNASTLAGRPFSMELHHEMRTVPGYMLNVAKGGIKATPSDPSRHSGGNSGRGFIDSAASQLSELTNQAVSTAWATRCRYDWRQSEVRLPLEMDSGRHCRGCGPGSLGSSVSQHGAAETTGAEETK